MTVKPICKSVETAMGVALTVTGIAQTKIMYNKEDTQLLKKACENLGRSTGEIEEQIQDTLEGHLRAIIGQLTVEQIYQDRDEFSRQVRETASPDLGKMGVQILSFVIQEIYDEVEYLSSIGARRTAEVKKDAEIGITNATKDAEVQEAVCDQART